MIWDGRKSSAPCRRTSTSTPRPGQIPPDVQLAARTYVHQPLAESTYVAARCHRRVLCLRAKGRRFARPLVASKLGMWGHMNLKSGNRDIHTRAEL